MSNAELHQILMEVKVGTLSIYEAMNKISAEKKTKPTYIGDILNLGDLSRLLMEKCKQENYRDRIGRITVDYKRKFIILTLEPTKKMIVHTFEGMPISL